MRIQSTLALPFVLAGSLLGCGDDESSNDQDTRFDGPVYAVQALTFGTSGRFSYISLIPDLENQSTIKLATAQEFPEYAPADAWDGKLVVGSGEAPTLTKYDIGIDGSWNEEQTVSFSAYQSLPLLGSAYVTPSKAYVTVDGTKHVIWNPETAAITGEVAAPSQIPLVLENGYTIERSYGHESYNGKLFQPYYYRDTSFHLFGGVSPVAVIDSATDATVNVFDIPCPHVHVSNQDDDGNIYFSNGVGSVAAAVLREDEPKNCFARIKAGETTIDPTFTTHFADITGGREGSNFFYLGNDVAMINVYHAERDNLTPDSTIDQIDQSGSYHIWTVNMATKTGAPVEGLDFGGGQFSAFRIDSRTFIAIPAADYGSTAVYEVLANGTAEKRFDTEGWTFKMFRVR